MTQLVPVELGEFCKVDSGFAFKSEQFSDDCNDVFLVKGSNLGHRQIKWDEGPWWNVDDYEKLERYQLREQDVLLAMDRPIVGGQLKYSWIKEGDPKSLLVQRVARLRAIEPEDQKFLRYVIASPAFLQYIDTITTGVNVPHISGPDIRKYKFNLLEKGARLKIAEIIDAYDDLIENNLKRIKLLEEMAQITYEEWFVRMKFPGHETAMFDKETGLPEGWSASNLGHFIEHEIGGGWGEEEASKEFSESAYVIRGTDFDGLPTGKTQNVPLRWHKKSNLASRKLAPGDIIFEVSGGSQNEGVAKTVLMTEELLSLFNEDVMCASFCKLARPISTEVGHYLFYFLRFLRKIKASEVFEIRSASNIVNYNWTAFLKFQEVNLPSESLLGEFHTFSENSTKQTSVLAKQVKLLKEARDILLPRLMTGMIDIEQVKLPEAMLKRLEEQEDKMATA
tara:strand:- start:10902 stop:12254 length:1353 start_codon:yes stop_codon:yes gene_type:complete